VEGLVHISELAQQHVENPREIVAPGDEVKVKILEIDSERRRLSLSIKRVEGQVLPLRTDLGGDAGDLEDMPELGLSEDVFAEAPPADEEGEVVDGIDEADVPSAEAAAAAPEEYDVEAPAPTVDELPAEPTPEETATEDE
jgi:small subunit ribosomal protein S1